MPYQPRASLDNPYGPLVTFRTEDVLPPSALYLSADDTPVFMFITNTAGSTGIIILRLLMPDGEIRIEQYQTQPFLGFGQQNFFTVNATECYLLSMMVTVNLAQQGSVWCQCFVVRGTFNPPYSGPPPYGGMVIVQGYLDDYGALAWPNSPIVEPGTGAGRMRSVTITPANGTNFTFTVPSLTRWEVMMVQCRLATDATPTTRQVTVIVNDQSGTPCARFPTNFTQAASLTYGYYFYNSAAHIFTNSQWVTAPIPRGLMLDNHWTIGSGDVGMGPGDAWSFVTLTVREWVGICPP